MYSALGSEINASNKFNPFETNEEVTHAIMQICACKDDFSLNALLRRILPLLGGDSYIYSTFLYGDSTEQRESYKWLIGCDPTLCQLYNKKKWYMNDVNIEYGRSHSAVIPSADIPRYSSGQMEGLQAAQKYGFLSSVIIPAHTGTSERIALLHVGSSLDPATGNMRLMSNRITLRSIAMEVLDWWIVRLRMEARKKFHLTDEEIAVLKLLKRGLRAVDIGMELGISAKAINVRVRTIKEKFGVDSIKAALNLATIYGLLDNSVVAPI